MNPFAPRYRSHRFYGAFLLYFLILVLGSVPHARAEIGNIASGIVLHAGAYSLITTLLATGSRKNQWARLLQAFTIVLIMGAADEYVQSFFAYRHAAVFDWLVDCGASLITVFVIGYWPKLFDKNVLDM